MTLLIPITKDKWHEVVPYFVQYIYLDFKYKTIN